MRELVIDLPDAAFDEALLLAGGVVLRVLAQVAVRASLGNRLDHARAILGLEPAQLNPELVGALLSQWLTRHTRTSL